MASDASVDSTPSDGLDGRREWVFEGETEYRPSLSNLDRRQQTALDELVDGFADRKGVLRWVQRLGVVTLGRLPNRVMREVALDRTMLHLLVVTPDRKRFIDTGEEPTDLGVAERYRERLAGRLLPFTNEAVRDFRDSAVEYLDDEARPDPDRHEAVAHRPSLSELDERQRRALDALIEGELGSYRDVVGWARSLNLASEGEINSGDAHGREFLERVTNEDGTLAVLIADESEPRSHERARLRFGAYHLLPAFNAGVRALWRRSGEDTTVESDGLTVKSL